MAFKVIFRLTTSDLKGIPEEARWAEGMGFDGLCADETNHDPFFPVLLAAAATSRVTLQTRVALAFPRSPMVVAYAAIDLQNFSGGRFRLGLGTQVKDHIERRFSVKWGSPAPRMREYVQSLHAIWDNWQDGKDLDFQGRFYRFDLMTPYFSPGACPAGRPPVYITGVNPYSCRVAGEVCDGLSFHVISSPEYIAQVIRPNIAKGAEKAGRSLKNINVHGTGFVITGPDRKTVKAEREVVRNRLAFYFSTSTYHPVLGVHGFQDIGPRLHDLSLQGRWDDMPGLITDEMIDAFSVSGVYEDLADQLKARFDGLADDLVIPFKPVGQGSEARFRNLIKDLQA